MPASIPLIQAQANLLADIKTNFMGTYSMEPQGILKDVVSCMNSVPMQFRQERFFYYKSLSLPVRIEYGESPSASSLEQSSYVIDAYKYGKMLSWSEDDAKDDRTKSLPNVAKDLGTTMKNIPIRIFFQIIQDASNNDLLGASSLIPDAPDGAAIFSATDGASAARFGVSGGNIVTQTGTTAATITTDFFSAMARFRNFMHTDGSAGTGTPLIPPEALEEVIIFYPNALVQAFAEAFIRTEVANASSVFAGSNVIQESGFKVKLCPTSYLTDATDWYIFLPKLAVKPIVFGQREGLQTREFNSQNSASEALSFRSFYMVWERMGFAVNLPYGAIKVA